MARVIVVEERNTPRVADLLVDSGVSAAAVSAPLDEVLRLARSAGSDLVVLEVISITRAVLRTCIALVAALPGQVVVCAERATERDIIEAYSSGAQVVVIEPVGSHELVARIRAVLRRVPPRAEPGAEVVVMVGPVVLDRARRQVTVDGQLVTMPRKEFDIAEVLICNAGAVVSRAQLVRELWGSTRDTKTLDVQVGRLRAKLAAAEGRQRIITVRGLGYRFATDDEIDLTVDLSRAAVRGASR